MLPTADGMYRCRKCLPKVVEFDKKPSLQRHIRRVHPHLDQCKFCEFKCPSAKLQKHLHECHPSQMKEVTQERDDRKTEQRNAPRGQERFTIPKVTEEYAPRPTGPTYTPTPKRVLANLYKDYSPRKHTDRNRPYIRQYGSSRVVAPRTKTTPRKKQEEVILEEMKLPEMLDELPEPMEITLLEPVRTPQLSDSSSSDSDEARFSSEEEKPREPCIRSVVVMPEPTTQPPAPDSPVPPKVIPRQTVKIAANDAISTWGISKSKQTSTSATQTESWHRPKEITLSHTAGEDFSKDPRLFFAGAPSSLLDDFQALKLRELRSKARQETHHFSHRKEENPAGVSSIHRHEWAVLPNGIVYNLRTTWVPPMPVLQERGTQSDPGFF